MPPKTAESKDCKKLVAKSSAMRILLMDLFVSSNTYIMDQKIAVNCMLNFNECRRLHGNAVMLTRKKISLPQLILECSLKEVLAKIDEMFVRKEFPDIDSLTEIIKALMCCSMHDADKLLLALSKLTAKFPPCWPTMRDIYLEWLQTEIFADRRDCKNTTLLEQILDMLHASVTNCTAVSPEAYFGNLFELYPSITFRSWIRRLCSLLNVVTNILDYNLSIWLLHDSHQKTNADDHILSSNKSPYVAVLLGMTKKRHVPPLLEKLIAVYTLAASKGLRYVDFGPLNRLLNLIMELSSRIDIKRTPQGILYPLTIGNHTIEIVRSCFHMLVTQLKGATNIQFVTFSLNMIESSHWPSSARCAFVICLLDHVCGLALGSVSLKRIHMHLKKRMWLLFEPDGMQELGRAVYMDMLLYALVLYCKYFGLNTCMHIWADSCVPANQHSQPHIQDPGNILLNKETIQKYIIDMQDLQAIVDVVAAIPPDEVNRENLHTFFKSFKFHFY